MNAQPQLTEEEQRFVLSAVKEWRAIKQGREFNGWMKIGAALMVGRRAVMVATGTNRPEGKAYNTAFSDWCRRAGFTNPEIDPSTRSHLLYLQEPEHHIICDELRQAMSHKDRLRISHPAAMARRVRAYLRERDGEEKPRRATALEKARVQMRDLEQQLAHAEEALAGRDIVPEQVVLAWFETQSAETLSRLFTDYDEAKAKDLADAIMRRLTENGEWPADRTPA
jgi:hypothetical protein